MCLRCSGIGRVVTADPDTFLDLDRSLEEGAILLPGFGKGKWFYRQYADIGLFDPSVPVGRWPREEREALIHGAAAANRLSHRLPKGYEGLLERFTRIYIHSEGDTSERKQAAVDRFTTSVLCPDCRGERLNRRPAACGWRATQSPRARRWRCATWSRWCAASTTPPPPPSCRAWSSGWRRWSASAWATSAWTGPPPPCRAASPSGSRWCATWAAA